MVALAVRQLALLIGRIPLPGHDAPVHQSVVVGHQTLVVEHAIFGVARVVTQLFQESVEFLYAARRPRRFAAARNVRHEAASWRTVVVFAVVHHAQAVSDLVS